MYWGIPDLQRRLTGWEIQYLSVSQPYGNRRHYTMLQRKFTYLTDSFETTVFKRFKLCCEDLVFQKLNTILSKKIVTAIKKTIYAVSPSSTI